MGKLSLRRTQLIVPFGVGSIVNMPDQSLMACGIDFWDENTGERIYDERLQRRLGINHFKMPASSKANDKGVPFVRFPQWMFCVSCRSLRPISTWKRLWENKYGKRDDYQPRCDVHRIALIAARFIVACENGHIDDFPWLEWVHGNKGICNKPDLTYKTGGSSAGLEGISIECKNCGHKRSMVGSFDREIFPKIGLKCKGHKPWQKSHESCDLSPLTLQRGASNVYFPKIVSSIFIPPFSDDVCSKIRKTPEWAILSSQTGGIDDSYKENLVKGIIAKAIADEAEIRRLLEQMLGSPNGEIVTQSETEYRYDEFKALTGQVRQGNRDSKQFSIEIVAGAKYKIDPIDKVVLVHRLRELRALVAFSRIKPLDREELGSDDEDGRAEVRAVPVRERANIDWFPAVEVRGEGIFITFNMDKIQQWAQKDFIKERVALIQDNHAEMARKFNRKNRIITPAFVLLHTFAHVLIRQFSYECGYSSASLRERIYCSEDDNVNQMAAVLIYTASGDSEGTLGGLVNQGKSEKLSSIISDAISQSLWCSSDPVCIDSRGQGMGSLNLAACHACVLLSETSCEENNKLLDRAMLVGTPEHREVGFFSSLL